MDASGQGSSSYQSGLGGALADPLPPTIQPIPRSAVIYCRFGMRIWGLYALLDPGPIMTRFRPHPGDFP